MISVFAGCLANHDRAHSQLQFSIKEQDPCQSVPPRQRCGLSPLRTSRGGTMICRPGTTSSGEMVLTSSGVMVFHFMTLKLQKPSPIDLVGGSQEPSPTVYVPSNPKAPRSPDSVSDQYSFSLLSKFTVYLPFPTLCCGVNNTYLSDSWSPVGTSEVVFIQHSKDFLVVVVRMSPLRYHVSFPLPSLDLESPTFLPSCLCVC